MNKEEYRNYIKQFNSISILNISRDLGLEKDYVNITQGTASKKKLEKVIKEIKRRLKVLGENYDI